MDKCSIEQPNFGYSPGWCHSVFSTRPKRSAGEWISGPGRIITGSFLISICGWGRQRPDSRVGCFHIVTIRLVGGSSLATALSDHPSILRMPSLRLSEPRGLESQDEERDDLRRIKISIPSGDLTARPNARTSKAHFTGQTQPANHDHQRQEHLLLLFPAGIAAVVSAHRDLTRLCPILFVRERPGLVVSGPQATAV